VSPRPILPPPRIRAARPADRAAVSALLLEQLAEHDAPAGAAAIRRAVATLLGDPALGRVIVAERAGRLVGVAQLSFGFALEHGGRTAWLDELFVEPASRGAGVGAALLGAALAEARRCGARAVDLEVDARHARAARLYRRAGFRRLRRARYAREVAQGARGEDAPRPAGSPAPSARRGRRRTPRPGG